MPNSKNSDSQKSQKQDNLSDERLDSDTKNKDFKEAKRSNPDSFKSFSDGLEAVDKFDIVGISSESKQAQVSTEQEKADSSFQSFGDGLETVDKFSISGAPKLDSGVQYLPLNNFLEHHSFKSIYEPLKQRSKTLKELLERVEVCAWNAEITVFIHPSDYPCEYDLREHYIHIDTTKSEGNQILDLAHQLYHSAHRYLKKLYGKNAPIDEEIFLDTFYWSEVGALLCELNVRKELNLEYTQDIGFKIKSEDGQIEQVYIEEAIELGGLDRLRDRISDAIHRDDFLNQLTLKKVLTTFHQNYLRTYEESQNLAKRLIQQSISNGIEDSKI